MAPPPPEFDTSRVSPQDAIVTLRSLRRRFAEAFARADDPRDVTDPPAPGELSPLGHAVATTSALAAIGAALDQVRRTDNPHVELPRDSGGGATLGGATVEAVLDQLGTVAKSLADTMADIHGDSWNRPARTGAGPVTALDIARLAVRLSIEHLRAAERTIGGSRESD